MNTYIIFSFISILITMVNKTILYYNNLHAACKHLPVTEGHCLE